MLAPWTPFNASLKSGLHMHLTSLHPVMKRLTFTISHIHPPHRTIDNHPPRLTQIQEALTKTRLTTQATTITPIPSAAILNGATFAYHTARTWYPSKHPSELPPCHYPQEPPKCPTTTGHSLRRTSGSASVCPGSQIWIRSPNIKKPPTRKLLLAKTTIFSLGNSLK